MSEETEGAPEAKPAKYRRPPEWWAMCRRVRGMGTKEEVAEKARERQRKEYREKNPKKIDNETKLESAMEINRLTGYWRVAIPSRYPGGKRKWLSTGEKDHAQALKVIDACGLQKLSMLARTKIMTHDAIDAIASGHKTPCAEVAKAWQKNLDMDHSFNTRKTYYATIGSFFKQMDCGWQPVSVITRENLHQFINDPKIKQSSRSIRLAAIRSFYRHAAAYAHIIGNIADTVKIKKSSLTVEQREMLPAIPFTHEEYLRIMANAEVPQFWRWATAIGYWLGLRLVDVCRFEWTTMGDDFAVLYPQKTGRKLILPLHDPLIGSGELKRVFDEIRSTIKQDGPYCFPAQMKTYRNGSPVNIYVQYRRVLDQCGINEKTFHGWRHSFRLRMTGSGRSLDEICRLMGHTSLFTTRGYGRSEDAKSA